MKLSFVFSMRRDALQFVQKESTFMINKNMRHRISKEIKFNLEVN